jgi:hypothetical protein
MQILLYKYEKASTVEERLIKKRMNTVVNVKKLVPECERAAQRQPNNISDPFRII